MIRLFLRLLGITDFEVCPSCETLKLQLEIANNERAELLKTMLGLVKPEVIQHPIVPVKPFINKGGIPWAIRKKGLEEKDREEMRIKNELKNQNVKTDSSVEELEKELGVDNAREIS